MTLTATPKRRTRTAKKSLALTAVTACACATRVCVAVDFYTPSHGSGSMLADAGSTGLSEPLNVIISGASDEVVLSKIGFLAYMISLQMSGECLGYNQPAFLSANLGDGSGQVNSTATLRHNFGDIESGTCRESISGGNHLRYWQQNGPTATSSAWFLAVSVEQNMTLRHNIVPGGAGSNGYDLGRDWLAGNATEKDTSFQGWTFSTTAKNVQGILPAGSSGINHDLALDGIVKLLTVKVAAFPSNESSPVNIKITSDESDQVQAHEDSRPLQTTVVEPSPSSAPKITLSLWVFTMLPLILFAHLA